MISGVTGSGSPRTITLERTFNASIEEVWDLWTTKAGIESWWGPDGFTTQVHSIDLRPGGELAYAMTAVGPDQIAFLRSAGMPLVQEVRVRYTDVVPPRRLAFSTRADFVPDVAPYDLSTAVDFSASAAGVRMVVSLEKMHDEQWTQMTVMGWESQLSRLARVLQSRRG